MNNNCVSNNWVHFQTEEMEDREEHFKYTSQNYKKKVQVVPKTRIYFAFRPACTTFVHSFLLIG